MQREESRVHRVLFSHYCAGIKPPHRCVCTLQFCGAECICRMFYLPLWSKHRRHTVIQKAGGISDCRETFQLCPSSHCSSVYVCVCGEISNINVLCLFCFCPFSTILRNHNSRLLGRCASHVCGRDRTRKQHLLAVKAVRPPCFV